MNSLFNITAKAREIALALENDELTEELENELVINQQELQEKSLNYAYCIKSLEVDVDAIDNEIKRLRALKEAKTNAIDRMKEAVINAFQVYGITEVKSPTLKLSLRRSEAVQVTNENQLSGGYLREKITFTPDKELIKAAIKSGKTVEGAVLIENLNLQIK